LGWKGESKIKLSQEEFLEIQDILISLENFTYSELQVLDNETVQIIFEVKTFLSKGQKMKEKTSTPQKPNKK
jgi:hypothetical protein